MRPDLRFVDHGVPVEAQENRSAVLSRGPHGHHWLVLFSTDFLLNIDLHTRQAEQVFYPDPVKGAPFSSFCASTGLAYAGANAAFMEFSPWENRFTYHATLDDAAVAGFSFAEDGAGNIYSGSYSHRGGRLYRYSPASRKVEACGRMDDYGFYLDHLAIDADGWIYMGVGTEKRNLIAYHPAAGVRRQLCPEAQRTRGSAYVHTGVDGRVYAHLEQPDVGWGFSPRDHTPAVCWLRLQNGTATECAPAAVAPPHYYNYAHKFGAIHSPFMDASCVHAYDLGDRKLVYTHPETREDVTLALEYATPGAGLSPMVGGPDGKLYGTSNHPMHGYTYDPGTNRLTDHGGSFYQESGGGNICAYAVQGDTLAGAAYYGGKIHLLDTSKPFRISGPDKRGQRNPELVARHKEILRPRCAAAHVNGEHVIFGGFGENGGTGGGLCIYNISTGRETVIENKDLLVHHSTLCLRVLANGDLIAGTSTASPCGGTPKADEAELYILDWNTKTVRCRCVPVAGQPEIALLEIDDGGFVHGITSQLVHFVFDPAATRVSHRQALPENFGPVVRDGLLKGPDGKLYGLCRRAIYSIDADDFSVRRVAEPPTAIGSGMALLHGRIYFSGLPADGHCARATHLWSYGLTDDA